MLQMAFGGNPLVLELLEKPDTDIDLLLDIDSFPAQFRNSSPQLQKYMNASKYQRLVEYITVLSPQNEGCLATKNRGYKYPFVSAQILSTDNQMTLRMLLNEEPIVMEETEKIVRWVEKEVDECDSEYCSSNGSNRNLDFDSSITEPLKNNNSLQQQSNPQQQNIPPKTDELSDHSSSERSSKKSINSDDFPLVDVGVKKTIKVQETVYKQTKKEIKPFLWQIYEYFERQANQTLTGYICKVLELVLRKSPQRLIKSMLTRQVHTLMLRHCSSSSMCDFLVNVLINPEKQQEQARLQLYLTILTAIKSDTVIGQLGVKSFTNIVNEVISRLDPFSTSGPARWHRKFLEYICSQPVLKQIHDLSSNIEKNYFFQELGLTVMYSLLKKVNPVAPQKSTSGEEEDQQFLELKRKLTGEVEVLFKDFINQTWDEFSNIASLNQQALEQMTEKPRTPSLMIIRRLEICTYLLRENLYWSRIQLSSQHTSYKQLVDMCKLTPSNNLLHNNVFDVLKFVVNQADEENNLISKMFKEAVFLSFLLEGICCGRKGKYPLYRGQCLILCHMIRNSHLQAVKQLRDASAKWRKIELILNPSIEKNNRSLGGFAVKKMIKPQVMFNKQSILERYKYFLRNEIPEKTDGEDEEEEQVEDLTSSRGSTEWTDWNDFNSYSADNIDD